MSPFKYKVFADYVSRLAAGIPFAVYEVTASVFCIGLVILVTWKGIKRGIQYSLPLLLVDYVLLMFSSTVFCRTTNEARKYDFHPFWSYRAIQDGQVHLLPQNIMNVVVFIPIGLLLGVIFRQMAWWKALLAGFCISVSIETLQFVFYKGFCEIDDIMHNTLGCLIGYLVCQGARKIFLGR